MEEKKYEIVAEENTFCDLSCSDHDNIVAHVPMTKHFGKRATQWGVSQRHSAQPL